MTQCDELGCTSTGEYVGDIYYACNDHRAVFEQLLNGESE